MYKKRVSMCILICFTGLFIARLLNIFKSYSLISDFIAMIKILNLESSINPVFKKGLIFGKELFLFFIFSYIALLEISIILFKQFKAKKKESFTDSLCGTYNKRFLEQYMKKNKNLNNFSVMLLDIDFFKKYNDNYGHVKGDETLAKIGRLLKEHFNKDFKVIRYGGEEFCILLPDTNKEECVKLANNILDLVADLRIKHNYSPISNYLTISIGISNNDTNNSKNRSLLELIELADIELYKTKNNGRKNYSYNDE